MRQEASYSERRSFPARERSRRCCERKMGIREGLIFLRPGRGSGTGSEFADEEETPGSC